MLDVKMPVDSEVLSAGVGVDPVESGQPGKLRSSHGWCLRLECPNHGCRLAIGRKLITAPDELCSRCVCGSKANFIRTEPESLAEPVPEP